MHVYLEKTNTHKELFFNGTVKKLLTLLAINPVTVIVVKDLGIEQGIEQQLITVTSPLKNTDSVLIKPVISGG